MKAMDSVEAIKEKRKQALQQKLLEQQEQQQREMQAEQQLDDLIRRILTPEAKTGDWVLLHTGYAISIVAPEEAKETLKLLRELSEVCD